MIIRFRRLSAPTIIVDHVKIQLWEIAFSEKELFEKLDGELAEVIMPEKPLLVRIFRFLFPLHGQKGEENGDTFLSSL
jgi:hypothetical protein